MRLKRLELKGFKSFAHETVIHFEGDVIGIVGPNGSGKSNIVDAFRWVLGEQKTTELRLEQMSDVIFNGTREKRESGLAHVTLTFENTRNILPTEYNTVTIARYLYRSGESEYRLNDIPCRLKDIRSLFLDTGIGSNSYAIIALGMVEDILSDKDNARRRMFEQAAGISKYKIRKKETLRKLQSTNSDLDRVEDLLFEIEQNLKSLEKQADRAKRFKKLKDSYRQYSLLLAKKEITFVENKEQELNRKIIHESQIASQIETEKRGLEAELEKLKKGLLDEEKSLSKSQSHLNDLLNQIRNKENQKDLQEQRSTFLVNNLKKINQNLLEYNDQIESARTELKNNLKGLQNISEQEQLAFSKQEEVQRKYDRLSHKYKDTKGSLDNLGREIKVYHDELIGIERQLAVLDNQIHYDENRQKELSLRNSDVEQDLEDIQIREKQLLTEISNCDQQLKLVQESENKRLEARNNLENLEDKYGKQLISLNRAKDALENEYQLTKDFVDRLEGFPESVKFLSKTEKWTGAPLLSDIIECSDPYKTMLENYLEPFLNHYVVDTIEEAITGVELLNQSQKGRANFFVLEAFENEKSSTVTGPGKKALNLIRVDDKYYHLIKALLGEVFIVSVDEKLDPLDRRVFIVENGKIIKGRNTVFGGSTGLFEGKKLGRKQNLISLQKRIKSCNSKIEVLEEKLDSINEGLIQLDQEDNKEELNKLKQNWDELNKSEIVLKSQREQIAEKVKNFRSDFDEIAGRLTLNKSKKKELLSKLTERKKKTDELEKNSEKLGGEYNTLYQEVNQLAEQLSDKRIHKVQLEGQRNNAEQQVDYLQRRIEQLERNHYQDQEQKETDEREIERIVQLLKDLENSLRALYLGKENFEKKLNDVEQSFFDSKSKVIDMEEELRKLFKKGNDCQILINSLKEKENELNYKKQNILERLSIEFGVDDQGFMVDIEDEEIELDDLKQKVERQRKRIHDFGEINPMALEAFNEMQNRYENIVSQRDDILEAKNSLMDTINEIEQTATENFLQSFSQVRSHFIKVFRHLFTHEDDCDLILLDPSDPLSSNIEIIAKPKGKRPKSISQLSGGEKTLTAVALLFALYLLKPAPFCIFDEVDAPLDDQNIEKFNRIIKEFSQESQFIIVTHNKLTMSAVDIIYGVFMQEKGISAVTPVDFRSFDHTLISTS